MIRPVAHQTDSARIRRHHHVTETRQAKARSADHPTGPYNTHSGAGRVTALATRLPHRSAGRRAVIRGTFAMSAARRNPRSAQHAAAWPEYLCRAVLHGECALLPRPAERWRGRSRRTWFMGWPQSADVEIRDNLAEMPLPLSLADAAVDPFPQEVGVAAVTGVLLDHVDQNRAQRDASAIPIQALDAQVG